MNKRDYEDTEAQEDPTADTEEELDELDGEKEPEKGKEKVDSLPPKKRARKVEVRNLSVRDLRAKMRQDYDALNARVDILIWKIQNT